MNGDDDKNKDGALSGDALLRARLERLRAVAAQHRAELETRATPPASAPESLPPSPQVGDTAPAASTAPPEPSLVPMRVPGTDHTPDGQPELEPEPEPEPELEDYPYAPRVARPAAAQEISEVPGPVAPTPIPLRALQMDPVQPAPGDPPDGRRAGTLSELRAREAERERERVEAERRLNDRRFNDRRSDPAYRDDPPPRVPPGAGAFSGPQLIAENDGLIARNLGKQYKKRPVLRDVSLSVQRGEAVGLLGPNGAGKTTCFYIMMGLIAADYGEILMDGQDVTLLPMYRRARLGIGYLPQEASIFRGLTVEQNIRAILEAAEPDRDQREVMLEDLMAEFSITHLRRTPAIALSGGERRRLEIARALATRPNFILLDEPLAGIDPIAVRDIRELVKHLKDRGLGVLITDHNVRETLDIVDRAYILHDGRVLMEGKPAEIVSDTEVRRVYLGDRFSL